MDSTLWSRTTQGSRFITLLAGLFNINMTGYML